MSQPQHKCHNGCGRGVKDPSLHCHSCHIWVGHVRQAKRNIDRYWEKCRWARGKK